jgi:hypothetical protein
MGFSLAILDFMRQAQQSNSARVQKKTPADVAVRRALF